MSFRTRAASLAAVSSLAVVLLGTTTPGLAQQSAHAPITAFNALTLPQVPLTEADTAEPVQTAEIQTTQSTAPAKLQPAILTDQDDMVTASANDADDADYETLAAAVAAQTMATENDRELQCLASGVFHESNGEPLAGQLAVAQTIVNRAQSGRFAKSICGVLTQRGQFSFVRGGSVPMATGRAGWKTAVAVAKVAYRDLWEDVAPKALFFHARRVSPGWRLARVATIGNHVFYR